MVTPSEQGNVAPNAHRKISGRWVASALALIITLILIVMWQVAYKNAFHPPQTFINAHVVFAGPQTNRICGGRDIFNVVSWVACDNIGPRKTDSLAVGLGDLNNDQLTDVVFGHISDNGSLAAHACLGTQQGRVVCQPVEGLNSTLWDIALGDLNNDGILDGVFAVSESGFSICLGDGTGELECREKDQIINQQIRKVALADFNRDGLLDVVLGSLTSNNLLCLGNDQSPFNCLEILDTNVTIQDLAIGDVNADGFPDVVFVYEHAYQICLNDGTGQLDCQSFDLSQASMRAVALGDINADQMPDAVFAGDATVICLSKPGPFYEGECLTAEPLSPYTHADVALGDVNADGHLDAVFSGSVNLVCLGLDQPDFECQQIGPFNHLSRAVALWQVAP